MNKICITEKGLSFLGSEANGKVSGSLPILRSFSTPQKSKREEQTNSPQSIRQNDFLERSSKTSQIERKELDKLTGTFALIKKNKITDVLKKKEQNVIEKLLKKEYEKEIGHRKIEELVHSAVKRNRNLDGLLFESRISRSRTYIDRILNSYEKQKKFWIQNHMNNDGTLRSISRISS